MAKRTISWKHDLHVYFYGLRLELKSAMSLRGAFAFQIIGMILNNAAIVVAWLFFFHNFGEVNGWGANELIAMNGLNMLIFGIMMFFSGGIMYLPRHVDRDSFDSFLTKPAPVLLQLAREGLDVTVFGDMLLGFILIGWYMVVSGMSLAAALVFLVALVIGLVIFWCLAITIPNLVTSYVFDSERLSRSIGQFLMDSGMYPTGVLTGVLRTILLTLLPGLFIGAVPMEVIHQFGWQEVVLGVFVSAVWLWFTLWLFRRSIRKYESSNLVGAR